MLSNAESLIQASAKLLVINYEVSPYMITNLIMKTASLQFQNGDINYLDWALLNNQAISIENDYLEAIHNLNAVVIQINYLNNN
jgi:cobalt-zinc-cadmium resistance protein CzcA